MFPRFSQVSIAMAIRVVYPEQQPMNVLKVEASGKEHHRKLSLHLSASTVRTGPKGDVTALDIRRLQPRIVPESRRATAGPAQR
jgi:hypothetical protein